MTTIISKNIRQLYDLHHIHQQTIKGKMNSFKDFTIIGKGIKSLQGLEW